MQTNGLLQIIRCWIGGSLLSLVEKKKNLSLLCPSKYKHHLLMIWSPVLGLLESSLNHPPIWVNIYGTIQKARTDLLKLNHFTRIQSPFVYAMEMESRELSSIVNLECCEELEKQCNLLVKFKLSLRRVEFLVFRYF